MHPTTHFVIVYFVDARLSPCGFSDLFFGVRLDAAQSYTSVVRGHFTYFGAV